MSDPLLTPYRLKHLLLKNRIITTAHEPAYTEDGLPKDRYRAYHAARAKGGAAMVMTAGSASVSRDSPPAFGNILAWKDEVVPWTRALVDACHDHGCAVMIQITHLGRRTRWDRGDWLPVVSSGRAREPAHRAAPKLAEDWDLERIRADYADAAERMAAAGMDGIELEAYGHLLDGFWSPRTNDLGPDWNGDLAARMAFSDSVIAAIRARVGASFIVGLRFTADEQVEGGLTEAEGLEVARRLAASGAVDFLNVIRGRIDTDAALTEVIPLQGMPAAPHLDFAGRVRAETGLPTFHAARIPDVATARHAIASGLLDLVGMTRVHLADPDIVAKIARGDEHRIRPCVGATYCLDRIYAGGEALCIHNAATGRELTMPQGDLGRSAHPRRVVVVGAGPGGLEAARVAGARGHTVTVLEAAPQAGGQLRLAASSPRRREMLGIVDWRLAECAEAGVAFRYNTLAEAEDVLALDPEVVVIATGGLPPEGPGLTVSAWDILSGDAAPGRKVLVWDEAGDHVGLQAAERLALAGAEVEVMTADRSFAPEVMGMNLAPYLKAMQPLGVRLTVAQRLLGVTRAGNGLLAEVGTDYSNHRDTRAVDQVVVNAGTVPLDELYHALRPHAGNRGAVDHAALAEGRAQPLAPGMTLWRIGDAVASRNVHAAIYDALRLLKDL